MEITKYWLASHWYNNPFTENLHSVVACLNSHSLKGRPVCFFHGSVNQKFSGVLIWTFLFPRSLGNSRERSSYGHLWMRESSCLPFLTAHTLCSIQASCAKGMVRGGEIPRRHIGEKRCTFAQRSLAAFPPSHPGSGSSNLHCAAGLSTWTF